MDLHTLTRKRRKIFRRFLFFFIFFSYFHPPLSVLSIGISLISWRRDSQGNESSHSLSDVYPKVSLLGTNESTVLKLYQIFGKTTKTFSQFIIFSNFILTFFKGKSIPVHCVVMNTTTPCYLSDAAMISSSTSPGGMEGGASTPNSKSTSNLTEESVDVDSYAIIPASTLFNQIVPVVLRKLGYSDDVIFNATGLFSIRIKSRNK